MNANNNANNENMATAGRRRALKRLERLKKFLENPSATSSSTTTTEEPPDILIGFRPIQIKYLERKKRQNEVNLDFVAEEASLTALIYVDAFFKLQAKKSKSVCVSKVLCCAAKSSAQLGELGLKIASALSQAMQKILDLNEKLAAEALENGKNLKDCSQLYSKCRNTSIKCE